MKRTEPRLLSRVFFGIVFFCTMRFQNTPADEPALDLPWTVNQPIVTVQKDRYFPDPKKKGTAWIDKYYVGPRLELWEIASVSRGDKLSKMKSRFSSDNGKTWSDFKTFDPPSITVTYNGIEHVEIPGPCLWDDTAEVLLSTWLRANNNGFHTYYRFSTDHGATWTTPKMLRYDEGAEFDPNDPAALDYIQTNQGYFGNNIIKHSNGTILTVLGDANRNRGKRNCSLCFIARWDPAVQNYQWTPGKRVEIAKDKSAVLSEPEVVELQDSRVLIVWRAECTDSTPGHKYFSTSADGGMTLSPPQKLKYDDGTDFFSPASFHRMVRSNLNGRLYWLGNITAQPPGGRGCAYPRYPLVIAEVDESGPIPSLKKNTVTLIDDRQADQPEGIEFSNFTLLQDRETHKLHLYIVVKGHSPTKNYKYLVTFVH